MRRITFLFAAVATLLVAAALFARGPIGPASILHKDVQYLVAEAAAKAGANVRSVRKVNPNIVPLRFPLEAKRMLKSAFAKVGLAYSHMESAEQFDLAEKSTNHLAHCTVRTLDDRVLGVVLDAGGQEASLLKRLSSEIQATFPGYAVAVRFTA